jgi:aspartate aminotransferase
VEVGAQEILVTNGLTQASFAAFMAWLDEGDEAILLDPYYPQHLGKIEMAGARAVIAPLDAARGFALDAELIRPLVTERTKVIALVNPCNPTGRVYTRAELEGLAELAIAHDLIVISDEVYQDITFDGARHIPIASLPGMKARTVTMGAFTKAYAMDGWRIGWIAADAAMMPGLMKVTTNEVTHVNTFIQHGALAALEGPPEVLAGDGGRRPGAARPRGRAAQPDAGRDLRARGGRDLRLPRHPGTGIASQELALRLMEEAGVVVEAGSFYGAGERGISGSASGRRRPSGSRRRWTG